MAEIEEIPINSEDIQEIAQDIPHDIPEKQTISEDIPKRSRGRPVGAKNKPKSKPKTAPKPKAKKKLDKEYEESEEEETPPRRRVRLQEQPPELDRHALASEVLDILQQQKYNKTNARRNHYASWFENM